MNFDRRSLLGFFLGAPIAASLPTRNDLSSLTRDHRPAPVHDLPQEMDEISAVSPLLEAWLKLPRLPLGHDDLDWATEFARNELHHALVTPGAGREQAGVFRDRLRELDLARQLLPRLRNGGPVQFSYLGGSSPGLTRSVLPTMLFSVPDDWCVEISWPEMDPIYLLAHCSIRHAPSTFKLANISSLKSVI